MQPGTPEEGRKKPMMSLGQTRRVARVMLSLSPDNPDDIMRVILSESSEDVLQLAE